MPTTLPPVLTTLFEAMGGSHVDAVLAVFAPDAEVVDDGEAYAGRARLAAWVAGSIVGRDLVSTPVTHRQEGDAEVVTVRVSGDFVGSPAEFTHRAVLKGEVIARLDITFLGLTRDLHPTASS